MLKTDPTNLLLVSTMLCLGVKQQGQHLLGVSTDFILFFYFRNCLSKAQDLGEGAGQRMWWGYNSAGPVLNHEVKIVDRINPIVLLWLIRLDLL